MIAEMAADLIRGLAATPAPEVGRLAGTSGRVTRRTPVEAV
jgi:choline dehydrogenase